MTNKAKFFFYPSVLVIHYIFLYRFSIFVYYYSSSFYSSIRTSEAAVLRTCGDGDGGELEALGGVERHEGDGALGGVDGVRVGDERDGFQVGAQQGEQRRGLCLAAGLDGFMIGRAAIGNPWVFRNNFRQNSVSWRERSALIAAHYRLMRETKAERACLLEFRKHLAEYVRGIADAKAVRQELFATRDEQTLLARIEALSGIDEQLPRAG